MLALDAQSGLQRRDDIGQRPVHAGHVDQRGDLRKTEDVVVDRLQRRADVARHALGFLVVRHDVRQQKPDQEDRPGHQAGDQPVDGDEFEAKSVDDELQQDQNGDNGNDLHQQMKALCDAHAAPSHSGTHCVTQEAVRPPVSRRGRRSIYCPGQSFFVRQPMKAP